MYYQKWIAAKTGENAAADVEILTQSAWQARGSVAVLPEDKAVFVPAQAGGIPAVVVSVGTTQRKTLRAFREAAEMAWRIKPSRVAVHLQDLEQEDLPAAIFGVGRGFYRYKRPEVIVEGPEVVVFASVDVSRELAIAKQQSFVRDLINCPSNLKPPQKLAQMIQDGSPASVEWTLFDVRALEAMGAGGILAVGQGSHRPPVLLVGRYQGAADKPWLALVGKGITFDSGGISIKPGEGMGRMKGDMGGAAAVAGAIRTIAEEKIPVNVMAVLPLAENLPGGGAYRPGDILTMMDGTEVEIISTDAEGRLVLADGVTWALSQNAAAVIDIATLTGANVVALGGIRSGLLANDDALAQVVREAADRMAEPCWELPHDEDYVDLIKSSAADIKNSGGRPAGTVTAGLFIRHFAKATPWAHLDIAGLSFEGDANGIGAGATGFGVATLVQVASRFR